jgi:hypothetical protein
MRVEVATGNEILTVVMFAALIAAAIAYIFRSPEPVEKVVVVEKPVKKVVREIGPGWGSGRWLGEGDFHYAEKMRHPFADQPRYAGHPFSTQDLEYAPPGPRLPMP